MTQPETFELTPELIRLLRASVVAPQITGDEHGAAAIDPKRPYGNSNVMGDIAEILNLPTTDSGMLAGEDWTRAHLLHEATPKALQIVLSVGSFQPGVYERLTPYGTAWKLVSYLGPLYATLTEINEHEGETWRYYIPITGNEDALTALADALAQRDDYGGEPQYELDLENPVPEGEVDVLVERGSVDDCGYMAAHQKLAGKLVLTPEQLGEIADDMGADPIYKGQIRDFMKQDQPA